MDAHPGDLPPEGVASAGSRPGLFRIADAAQHVGVSPSALRLWERQGLIAPARSGGRERLYTATDLARLRHIWRYRRVEGLNAAAIRRLLPRQVGVDPSPDLAPDVTPGAASRPPARPRSTSAAPGARDLGRDGRARARSTGAPSLEVADRLRRLRAARGLSLRGASEMTGLSASFISSVERGLNGASVSTLQRLTAAYGTTLGELLRDPELEGRRLVRLAERRIIEPGGGVRIEDLARAPSQLESQLFILQPGASSEGYYAHPGEELMYVLAGSLRVCLGETEEYDLSPGDALTFSSTLSHRFEVLGATETRIIWVNTPPTF